MDVGSRTDGFVAHVAVFREIEILDIREQKSKVKNISFRKADLMELQAELRNYCDSISSLHAIEHRVFSVGYLLELLRDHYDIRSFSYVNDAGDLFVDVTLELNDVRENFGCQYGCGIFELLKR